LASYLDKLITKYNKDGEKELAQAEGKDPNDTNSVQTTQLTSEQSINKPQQPFDQPEKKTIHVSEEN